MGSPTENPALATGPMIVAPRLRTQRCRGCKYQEIMQNMKVCIEGPALVNSVPDLMQAIPPGSIVQLPSGEGVPLGAGGLKVLTVRNEVVFPPAPDDWGCGRWKPRFLNEIGEKLE